MIRLLGDLLRRRLLVVTVEGGSMTPTFAPGDRLLVRRTALSALRRGDAVVLRSPGGDLPGEPPYLVKRAAALPGDAVPDSVPADGPVVPPGRLAVLGDNAAGSADSRTMGLLPADVVVGVVLRRMTR
jgi:signal peptidase I